MSYIGRGVDAISNVEKLDNITFNGGTTYALTKSSAAFTPVGANNILISIDGVIQQGNFSVSTTNIVFDWSPTSSNTNNFILHYGTGVLNVPADGSIVAAKMAANSVDSDSYVDGSIDAVHLSANSVDSDSYVDGSIDAVHLSANSVDSDAYVDGSIDEVHMSANSIDSDSYVDLSIDTAHIGATQVTGAKLNTDVISAQTELAVAPADTDEFMVSDGGVLKRIDYSLIKGGGTLVKTGSITTSGNAASAELTDCFTDTYKTYHIYVRCLNTASTGSTVRFVWKTSAGDYTSGEYRYACRYFDDDGHQSSNTGVNIANAQITASCANSMVRGSYSALLIAEHPTDTAIAPRISGAGAFYGDASGGDLSSQYISVTLDVALDATGLNIYPSSGYWTDGGSVVVYGVKE